MVASSSSALSAVVLAATAASLHQTTHAFVMPSIVPSHTTPTTDGSLPKAATPFIVGQSSTRTISSVTATTTSLYMSSTTQSTTTLSLQLEKPLGLILEETDDGNGGVIVTQINEGGSAFDSPNKDQLLQSKISTVMGQDVSSLSFDDVMDVIINAPSPLDIEFAIVAGEESTEVVDAAGEEEEEAAPAIPTYEVGTTVTITVQQPETNKGDITLEAKVGDNLRKTLLANNDIELYRGLKKKLGNCGGGGQCGYCAVELIDEGEGVWGERSDYEAQRIGKNGNEKCRLACMNNIVGPATVRTL